MTAKAFSEQNAQGFASPSYTSTFEIVDEPFGIDSFVLVDADKNKELEGDLDCKPFACLGKNKNKRYNIRAKMFVHVKSIVLILDGPITTRQVENVPPFSLFGDIEGDFIGYPLPPGRYTLTARAYHRRNARGKSYTTTQGFEIAKSLPKSPMSSPSTESTPVPATPAPTEAVLQ